MSTPSDGQTFESRPTRLETVRLGIDEMDEDVTRSWMRRGALVIKAGRLKSPGVTDPKREQQVLQRVRKIADEMEATQGLTLEGLPQHIQDTYEFFLAGIVELQQAHLAKERAAETAAQPTQE